MKLRNTLFVSGLLCGLLSAQASAAMVTLYGTDVSFTFDDMALGLYGGPTSGVPYGGSAPIVVGNSLIFQPTDFKAESLNGNGGAGAVTANQTLIIDVAATTPGFDITSVIMAEDGDYRQDGIDASVTASMRLGVTSTTTPCGLFACKDATITNVGGFGDTGVNTVGWSGSATVDLADTAGWGSDSAVQVSFQNNLSATTLSNGETASIQKKLGGVGLYVNQVPVPAAVWLFGSGLIGLVGVARRKRHN